MKIKFILFALSLISLNANAQQYNYDVNRDGKVTVSDVMLVVNKILGNDTEKPRYPLTISVSEKPIVDPNAPASSKKKTPVTTKDNLKEFYMDCTYIKDSGKGVVGQPEYYTHWVESDGKWLVGTVVTPGEGYWPAINNTDRDGTKVSWYAYAGVDIPSVHDENNNGLFFCEGYDGINNYDISKPYIQFIQDEGTGTTKDFLVAKTEKSYSECGGHLFFQFSHVCAAAQFFLKKSSKLNDATVNVKMIKLHNVVREGRYYFNEETHWVLENVKGTYTLWDSENYIPVPKSTEPSLQLSVATDTDKANDYFFFIPQAFTGWDTKNAISDATTGSYLEIVCKITDKNGDTFYGTAYLPFATKSALEAGTANTMNITLGTSLRDKDGKYILNTDGTKAN